MKYLILFLSTLSCFAQTFGRFSDTGFIQPVSSTTVSGATVPGIFVDSVAGSDSNPGTSNSPFATLTKLQQVVGTSATTNIYLKRGSVFRESLQVPTNSTIDAYGSVAYAPLDIYGGVVNSKPIISGAIRLTNANFSLLGGKTNTYQITLPQWRATNTYGSLITSNVLVVFEDNNRMVGWTVSGSPTYAYTTNTVDAGSNRFFFNTTSRVLYISPTNGVSPVTNGKFYEASILTLGLHGGDNFLVKNIIAEKCHAYSSSGQQGYQILGYGSGTYQRCVARFGWNHSIGVANSLIANPITFDSCTAGDCENGVIFVGYRDTGSSPFSSVIFTNCLAYLTFFKSGITAFYSHGDHVAASALSCVASNCGIGFEMGGVTTGTAKNLYDVRDATTYKVNSPISNIPDNYSVSNLSTYYGLQQAVSGVGISVINSKFVGQIGLSLAPPCDVVSITNNIFAHVAQNADCITWASSIPKIHFWSNTLSHMKRPYNNASTAQNADVAILSANYNSFYNQQNMGTLFPTNISTLANWKATWPNLDQNSVVGIAYTQTNYTVVDPTGGDAN